MTNNNYPITPPVELVEEWFMEQRGLSEASRLQIATQAARWGADIELEACREEIVDGAGRLYIDDPKLRVCLADDIWTARRPKPPSLKELNLKHLEVMERDGHYLPEIISDLRRAIESLPS